MMQNVKYAIAWLWGLAYMGSLWVMATLQEHPVGWLAFLFVVSFVLLVASTVGIVWIMIVQFMRHWDDK